MAMLRGMERALLEYSQLRAGIIFCLGREFEYAQNAIIVEKAIKYHRRGVVGIDIAGPGNPNFHLADYKELFQKARDSGLRVTTHSGEAKDANDMWEVLEHINPDRIGHGIKAAYDKALMSELSKRGTVLEVCPLSNLMTNAVENWEEMEFIIKTFLENNVKFCINTDWPEMIEDAHLYRQFAALVERKILTEEQLEVCNKIAFDSTFVPQGGLGAYL